MGQQRAMQRHGEKTLADRSQALSAVESLERIELLSNVADSLVC